MTVNKHQQTTLLLVILLFTVLCSPFIVQAKPKTKTLHGHNLEGFARAKIKNETIKDLACWVAIDGHKYKFRLPAYSESKWFTAQHQSFTYAHFSSWCDYIEFYPSYQQYSRGN